MAPQSPQDPRRNPYDPRNRQSNLQRAPTRLSFHQESPPFTVVRQSLPMPPCSPVVGTFVQVPRSPPLSMSDPRWHPGVPTVSIPKFVGPVMTVIDLFAQEDYKPFGPASNAHKTVSNLELVFSAEIEDRVRNRQWDPAKILRPPTTTSLNLLGTGFLLFNPCLKSIVFNFQHHGIYQLVKWVDVARYLVKASPIFVKFTVMLGALGHSMMLAHEEIEITNKALGVAGVMDRVPIVGLLAYPIFEVWVWEKPEQTLKWVG